MSRDWTKEYFNIPDDVSDAFDEFKKEYEKYKTYYDKVKLNGNYCDKISNLKAYIKKLTEENENLKKQLEAKEQMIKELKQAINSALNLLACPDKVSETECNEQLAFNILREVLK